MRTWLQALQDHRQELEKNGFRGNGILGIFCYGSQNYGVATENSDWDTKAIIIPSFEKMVLEKPVSKELQLYNKEHCEVKDIREMIEMFKKQNINFIEILFTQYFWINPYYQEIWNKYFIEHRQEIAHYDINKTIQSICGQALNTLKQNSNDAKKVANAYRLMRFIERKFTFKNYEDCIILPSEEREIIMQMKATGEMLISAEEIEKKLLYLKTHKFVIDSEQQEKVNNIMKKGILECFKIRLKKEKENEI